MSAPTLSPTDDRRLLLVESDRNTAHALAELFTEQGYRVDVALNGQRGLHLALRRAHRIMIIGRRLPVIDGIELVARLRRVAITARIMLLTPPDELADRIEGLDAGADDCLVKPFEPAELMAKVRALDRRLLDSAEVLPVGAGELDVLRREMVLPGGDRVRLSQREFELLRLLAANPRTIYRRCDLRLRLCPDAHALSIVDTYVYYLRRKLGRNVVKTVRGLGYQVGSVW